MPIALSPWIDPLLDLVFPSLCPVCGTRADETGPRPFCRRCWEALPLVDGPGCRVCGEAFVGLPPGLACAECRARPPAFLFARAAGVYRDGLRSAIHALKFRGRTAVAPPLARLLADQAVRLLPVSPAEWADAVVPVPLHPERLASRGFNQADLLAVPCAAAWGRPCLPRALVRTRATRPQTELDAGARQANVAGAFAVRRPAEVAGRRILLVDDVLTTGATVSAAARALRQSGAEAVGVLVVARVA